jgi:hypothetical protein
MRMDGIEGYSVLVLVRAQRIAALSVVGVAEERLVSFRVDGEPCQWLLGVDGPYLLMVSNEVDEWDEMSHETVPWI